jgi:hypothetical protein
MVAVKEMEKMYICLYRLVNSPYLLDFVVWNSIYYMEFQGHSQQALVLANC